MKSLRILVFSSVMCLAVTIGQTRAMGSNGDETSIQDSKIFKIQKLTDDSPSSPIEHKVQVHQKKSLSNHDLLQQLGLEKVHVPSGQGRKRLAEQSRHNGHPDDSDMFVIKLPPNANYYGNGKKHLANSKNSINDFNSKKIKLGFHSNGKLGSIYHWNLPVLQKMLLSKNENPNFRHTNEDQELLDIKRIPTWTNGKDYDTVDKHWMKKKGHKKSPTYYAPAKVQKVNKYFPGNGKPKSFYVMKKNNLPAHYQKLI